MRAQGSQGGNFGGGFAPVLIEFATEGAFGNAKLLGCFRAGATGARHSLQDHPFFHVLEVALQRFVGSFGLLSADFGRKVACANLLAAGSEMDSRLENDVAELANVARPGVAEQVTAGIGG